MVSFIWIGSAFFGVTTCFPDKGPYAYDVRNFFGLLDPSPSCHILGHATSLPFICFVATSLSPINCRRHMWMIPKVFGVELSQKIKEDQGGG